jgi:mannose-6-phosphate isomerase-like protein (cupin superfamily)
VAPIAPVVVGSEGDETVTGYMIVNLKEIEDQAPKFGHSPELEARFARVPLGLENSGLSYLRLAPNFRIPFGHKHLQQEEIYVLVGGSAKIKLDDEVIKLEPWDAIRVSAGTMRGFEAGPEGAEYIAFGAPNTENRDVELAPPNWWTN